MQIYNGDQRKVNYMAQETLTPKLSELSSRMFRLTGRIQRSQDECLSQLEGEIQSLARESAQNREELEQQLFRSKAVIAPILQGIYQNIQSIIQEGSHLLDHNFQISGGEGAVEEKILLAEFALDFAFQAADHALMASLQAMAAQLTQEQKERSYS